MIKIHVVDQPSTIPLLRGENDFMPSTAEAAAHAAAAGKKISYFHRDEMPSASRGVNVLMPLVRV